jgi:N-acetylglucosaminyldiphosphoundecaprenol N-acetyl-beta-D-mannosaminyltransferase
MTIIIGSQVAAINYSLATIKILEWVYQNESRYVCLANVHMLMEAHDSPAFKEVINSADLVTSDGIPLVWMMRLKGIKGQQRVYGPTLMLHLLRAASIENISVGFYGGDDKVGEALVVRMKACYPDLHINYSYSPPFRELDSEEDSAVIEQINKSGTQILFVGLGCPKQEIWMADHRGKVNAVMIGVGAAFDFHAGYKLQAPTWMQKLGLEWFFRLITEPRRLWKRYLYNNPRFVFLALMDLLGFVK